MTEKKHSNTYVTIALVLIFISFLFIVAEIFWLAFAFIIIAGIFLIGDTIISRSRENIEVVGEENRFGGTNLDRFYIECILANCYDFSSERTCEKAKLFAENYKLKYPNGIQDLFSKAETKHIEIRNALLQEEAEKAEQAEQEEYNLFNRYSDLYGKDKKRAMLNDKISELKDKKETSDYVSNLLMRSSMQQGYNWATYGGIANGLGGFGAGVATALEIQQENAMIEVQNAKRRQEIMPAYTEMLLQSCRVGGSISDLEKAIETHNLKLMGKETTQEVFKMLNITCDNVSISKSGTFKMSATVKANGKLFIYGDTPAVADGTIVAHLHQNGVEVGHANLVLPIDGVTTTAQTVGMGFSSAKQNVNTTITFTAKNLWLIER